MKAFFMGMSAVMVALFLMNSFNGDEEAGRDYLLYAILNLILFRIW